MESRSTAEDQSSISLVGPIELFISYARSDTDACLELVGHLSLLERQGLVRTWYDAKLRPGEDWGQAIHHRMQAANVILLLISKNFLASDFCFGLELQQAMLRHARGETVVIPLMLSPCDVSGAPFMKLQALPSDARPVTTWANQDEAWEQIVTQLRNLISSVQIRSAAQEQHVLGPLSPPEHLAAVPPTLTRSVEMGASPWASGRLQPPSLSTTVPAAKRTLPGMALVRWVPLALGTFLIGLVSVLYFTGRPLHNDDGVAAASANSVCCGGIGCPMEQQQAEGTSCEDSDLCRRCESGRTRVSGTCADPIHLTTAYRIRLANVTIPGYVPSKTDTICVQPQRASPVCATVSDAMVHPLLGVVRMVDLTVGPVDVWFDRGDERIRLLTLRASGKKGYFTNSVLCIGASLYSLDGTASVKFFFEDI